MTNNESSKVAIVTGGSRGVGAATAKLLASRVGTSPSRVLVLWRMLMR